MGYNEKCPHCQYKAKQKEHDLYKAKVKRNCLDSGKPILYINDNLKKPTEMVKVKCPDCKFETDYKLDVD